jgi:hypothetical protein
MYTNTTEQGGRSNIDIVLYQKEFVGGDTNGKIKGDGSYFSAIHDQSYLQVIGGAGSMVSIQSPFQSG